MATANAGPTIRQKALLPQLADVETKKLPLDLIALIGGSVVGIVLFIVAGMNVLGAAYLPIRPGEAAGWNVGLDWVVFGLIAMLAPYGFIKAREQARIESIETRLPDFLRDVAEAGRFGMTLPDAIITASKGRYGLLTEEIKRMASQLEWGVPVSTALQLFQERVPTPLVRRVVSIVTRANEAGGNVADVLTMVARNAREDQLNFEARRITMLTYVTVIYISFFVFLFTVLILAADFLPAMVAAGQSVANSAVGAGGASAVSLQFQFVPQLFLAFLVAVIAHAVGDGIMAGILHNARISDGLRHATILLAIGWLMMRFVVPPLNG
ncbi:MAG TPA: type II secretion system F family protein [Thermoplasmata archaeon]|nr:type II secretion system F family protein [Thermoplasmata archaeon]